MAGLILYGLYMVKHFIDDDEEDTIVVDFMRSSFIGLLELVMIMFLEEANVRYIQRY
jgi:hypothetical protein